MVGLLLNYRHLFPDPIIELLSRSWAQGKWMNRLDNIIAKQKLFGQKAGDERFPITIEVGRPFQSEGFSATEWACPVRIKPFLAEATIHGEGSLQALCLALTHVKSYLIDFLEKGGKLSWESGEAFEISTTFGDRPRKTP
jgi:hypothetical protein